MAATSSLLRMPEAPSMPISLARARSSGSTIVDKAVERAAGALVASSAAAVEIFGLTVSDSELLSLPPPAVIRSVSVTEFLSFPR
jgi:hypothetical protein